jgi:O-glycosyl hydrolase
MKIKQISIRFKHLLLLLLLGVFFLVPRVEGATEAGTITVDPSTTYQTISGWQAVAEIGLEVPNYELWRDTVADMAANDLGINRIMFLVRSDYEDPNDNNDPFVINPSGFDFSRMELQINGVVIPLKQSLASRGEDLHINLKFFNGDSPTIHSADPEEYAELIEAVFLHTQSNYGWVPDSVDVVNEPKSSWGWTGETIGNAILAAAARLETHGFTPFFIAPSGVNVQGSVSMFDDMVANVPAALQYLGEISYHCYGGCDVDANLTAVRDRALQHNIDSSMTEKIRHTYEDLHRDLKLARVSAWEQFALAFPLDQDNGAQYYVIDNSDPSNPVVNIGERTKFLRQYFKFIRSGALRIEATSTDGNFDPVAFINTGGDYVVVVKAGGN